MPSAPELADALVSRLPTPLRAWANARPVELLRAVERAVRAAGSGFPPGTVVRFAGSTRRFVVVGEAGTPGRVALVALSGSARTGEDSNARESQLVRDADQRVVFQGTDAALLERKARAAAAVRGASLDTRSLAAPPLLPRPEAVPAPKAGHAVAELSAPKLRAGAIVREAKLQARIAKGHAEDAVYYKRQQVALETVARMVDAGENLPRLRTLKDVEGLARSPWADWFLEAMERHGVAAASDFRDGKALLGKTIQALRVAEAKSTIGALEGYHPTPPGLAERVARVADLHPGQRVLEPSAGSGALADAARAFGVEPQVVERDARLQVVLQAKGYTRAGQDFALFGVPGWDRILMNPPFERGQDVEHVMRAFDLLAPGGRLVAIMSEGPFFRSDRKSTTFRAWLEEHAGRSERLPENSFKSSERSTGVHTRLVVIDKRATSA